jgi:small subunit ribosomal protein S16
MLKIRLQRVGRVHQPAFRVVLTEHANSTKSGRFKEILGSYDPRKVGEVLNADRIKHWLGQGVLPTPSVWNLLVKKGVVKGKKIHVAGKGAPVVASAPEAPAEAPSAPEAVVEAPAEVAVEAPMEAPAEVAPEAPAEPAPEASPEASAPAAE